MNRRTGEVRLGDTVGVAATGERGNVRSIGCGGYGVRMDRDPTDYAAPLRRLQRDDFTVVSTEEIDRARRVLERHGWTVKPPAGGTDL